MRLQLGVGRRQQRRRPIFVGDAEPAIGDVEIDAFDARRIGLEIFHFLVGVFLQAIEIADQAFMQDVVAGRLRRAVARNQSVGIERHGVRALVRHLVLYGEQIFVVDRNGAAELQSVAAVIAQRDGMPDGERARAFLLPDGVARRQFHVAAGGAGPAELRIERVRAAGRRQQHDRRRLGIDRLAELAERNVVDARALERDRSLQAFGRDRDALRSLERIVAVRRVCGRGLRGLPRCQRRSGGRRRGLRILARLRGRLLGLLLLLRLQLFLAHLLLRPGDEILPGQQHDGRQRDCNDGVLIVAHRVPVLPLRPSCTRRNAPSNSCTMRANGAFSAARRPTST